MGSERWCSSAKANRGRRVLARAIRGEFVAVRLIDHYFGGERAEIVQAGNAKLKLLPRLKDLMHGRGIEPVSQLDGVKSHIENFADDFLAGFTALRVPALRKDEARIPAR